MSSQKTPPPPYWLSAARTLIEPSHLGQPLGIGRAILCFTEASYDCLLHHFDMGDAQDGPGMAGAVNGKIGSDVAIYQSSFGAPAAGMLAERLIASGVERLLMVGLAGSLSPTCRIGDWVLPSWGVREEGTSYHYLAPDVQCRVSGGYLDLVKEYLKGFRYAEGGVWSTDAPYRETVDKIQAYAQQGVLAVEMECTALMAIALYRQVDFAAVLVITDEAFGDTWRPGFDSREVHEAGDLLCWLLARGFKQEGSLLAP